jgi:hypothetical protein
MQLGLCLDLDLIFPVNDEASARLMITKTECLLYAGVIDVAEACAVFRRAAEVQYRTETRQAA